MKYTLFMLFGGVPLLFAIIILAINHAIDVNGAIPQNLSFSLPVLLETQLPDNLQAIVFCCFYPVLLLKHHYTLSYLAAHCRNGRTYANNGFIDRPEARRLRHTALYDAVSAVCCC